MLIFSIDSERLLPMLFFFFMLMLLPITLLLIFAYYFHFFFATPFRHACHDYCHADAFIDTLMMPLLRLFH